MADRGQLAGTPYVGFVMGVKKAMPIDRAVLDFYIEIAHRLFSADAPWCAAGSGAGPLILNEWAIAAGGHVRTGLEDNMRLDRHRLAPSDAALVERTVKICEDYERPVATWRQAREMLRLNISACAGEREA
jgi:3-keto-5-aminohexanoate cleavage enzyme